jgi:hypothetical protein
MLNKKRRRLRVSESLDHLEERAEINCSLSWPAGAVAVSSLNEAVGRFKPSVGRTLRPEGSTIHQLPNCPLRLVRNADAFEEFYRKPLAEVHTKVGEPWNFDVQLMIPNNFHRKFLPPEWPRLTGGPFPPDQLPGLHQQLISTAESMWINMQLFYVASVMTVEKTGMTIHALQDLYRWLWTIKEGPDLTHEDIDSLRTGYLRLARSRLQSGDYEMAAQYAKVAFDLAPTDEAAEELAIEFAQVSARWNQLAVVKENVVKKVATVAREGFAEWGVMIGAMFVSNGLISPITVGPEEFLSQMVAHLQRIMGKSSTNPYRRGLELMNNVMNNLGLWPAMISGYLTEWPLQYLRLRVSVSSFEQMEIRRDSLWAPDTRLEKLAEPAQPPVNPEAMTLLYTIHSHLDNTLPGIITYALDQLARHSKEEL